LKLSTFDNVIFLRSIAQFCMRYIRCS